MNLFSLVGDNFKWSEMVVFGNQWRNGRKKRNLFAFFFLLCLLCCGFLQVGPNWQSHSHWKWKRRWSMTLQLDILHIHTAKLESRDEYEMAHFISVQRTQNTHFFIFISYFSSLIVWMCKKFHSWEFGSWIWMSWYIALLLI